MSSFDRRNWLDRGVGVCLGILIGALAISTAVHLIEAVWVTLVIIGSVCCLLALLIMLLRQRHRGW